MGGFGFGFFLPKSKFAILEIMYCFSCEARFHPLRLLRGGTDRRCTAAGKIKLEVVSHVLFHTFFNFFFFHLPISFTPPREEGKKNPNQTQTARALFLFPWEFCERGRV